MSRTCPAKSRRRGSRFPAPSAPLPLGPWSRLPPMILLVKLQRVGTPLKDFAAVHPLFGIKTGLNQAFLIDTPTKQALCIAADPACEQIIRPYIRGQDVDRWHAAWAGLWMIALKSSGDHPWPWADAGEEAEDVFAQTYPSIHRSPEHFREALIKRQDQGRYWWELRYVRLLGSLRPSEAVLPGYHLAGPGLLRRPQDAEQQHGLLSAGGRPLDHYRAQFTDRVVVRLAKSTAWQGRGPSLLHRLRRSLPHPTPGRRPEEGLRGVRPPPDRARDATHRASRICCTGSKSSTKLPSRA